MPTTITTHFASATSMKAVEDASVDLVVTSPPYPMVEMWDAMFSAQHPAIADALDRGAGPVAFSLMHDTLRPVWRECVRVLKPGGLLCVNIGDATRTVDGTFQLYANHARIVTDLTDLGLHALPGILWRKSTNKPNKFMGSGMLPPNAYVTLEHEHILIFRKDDKRAVDAKRREDRYASAYFWEERNRWFSDVWTDLTGVHQDLVNGQAARDRSAAFPLALPLRLIHMFSIVGDTVLDPFWGTGTTSIAAAMLQRNSIGYEMDASFETVFQERLQTLDERTRQYNANRIARHRRFLQESNTPCKYQNAFYDFGVVTRQERDLVLYDVNAVRCGDTATYEVTYHRHRTHGIKDV